MENKENVININIPQPKTEDIINQIISAIENTPYSKVGVMGFDGKMAYSYTVKGGGKY